MNERPKMLYLLIILWLLLSLVFGIWGSYSVGLVLDVPTWGPSPLSSLYPQIFFGHLLSMITWFVFAFLFIAFAYGTYKGKGWAWTTGLIISTLFIVIFGLILASLMVTAWLYLDFFSVSGVITVAIALLIDLAIVYCLTRPQIKAYFELYSLQ